MRTFVTLPSGLLINLALVTRVERYEEQGRTTAILYFSGGDSLTLSPDDAVALNRRLPSGPGLSSNVMTTIFWCVILASVLLLWLALRSRS